jgi:hypothetical protein
MKPRLLLKSFLFGLLLSFHPNELGAMKPTYPFVELSNDHVKMILFLPDAEKGYYRSTRFDWSGVIYSLKYKGHEYFGDWRDVHDPFNPSSISGPVDGFLKPGLGYNDAKPGGEFIRIGIGVIEKPDEVSYRMFEHYPIIDHGKWTIIKESNWIEFCHEVSSDNGYGYIYKKRIELLEDEPGFTILYSLKNTGTRPIETDQFNHNFFLIDKGLTGPDFQVSFPFNIQPNPEIKKLGSENRKVQIKNNVLTFDEQLSNEGHVWFNFIGFGDSSSDYGFEIVNKNSGAGVKVKGSKPLQKMVFWAEDNTLCPEPFIEIFAEPGDTDSWSTTYTFFEVQKL